MVARYVVGFSSFSYTFVSSNLKDRRKVGLVTSSAMLFFMTFCVHCPLILGLHEVCLLK